MLDMRRFNSLDVRFYLNDLVTASIFIKHNDFMSLKEWL
jgi:hypothetical protein